MEVNGEYSETFWELYMSPWGIIMCLYLSGYGVQAFMWMSRILGPHKGRI